MLKIKKKPQLPNITLINQSTYKPHQGFWGFECFEFDFETSKISKIIKDQEDIQKVKNYLSKVYKYIREAFKYFSAISPNNNVFSIGQLIFQEIINNTTVIHKELLTNSDVDLEYITTNAGVKQHKYNPDRALVRYQLLEIFVRLAIQKYYKSKVCETSYDAIVKLFENELLPYFKNFDCHIWRKTHLWTESCDIVYKAYLPVIKMLYKQNSGRYTKPGHTPFMSLEEFQEMITCTNITSESFGTREIGIHFNLSKMTETNEVDFEKHMQMQFIEFIEALGRIAEKLNLETLRQKFGFQEEEEDREFIVSTDSKLSTKIEFLIKILMDANLNFAGNDKKFRQLNKQIENNIKQNKTTQQLNNQIVPEKKESLMSIMISNFQQKQNFSRTLLGETPTPNTQSQNKFEFNSPHAQTFTAAMNPGNNIQKLTFAKASNFAMKNQNNHNDQGQDYMQNAIDQIKNDKPRSLGEILNVLKKAKQNQEKYSQQNYLNYCMSLIKSENKLNKAIVQTVIVKKIKIQIQMHKYQILRVCINFQKNFLMKFYQDRNINKFKQLEQIKAYNII